MQDSVAQADWDTISAGHEVNVVREYYEVNGETAAELMEEMQRKGPAGGNGGERYYATTHSQSSFRYETVTRGSVCSLSSIGVRTDITVRLPRYAGENDNSDLARAWRKFMKNLVAHEYGHVSISKAGSETMFLALKGMPSADCDVLKQSAQLAVKKISDGLQDENHNYDRLTGHGRSQGAVWMVPVHGR